MSRGNIITHDAQEGKACKCWGMLSCPAWNPEASLYEQARASWLADDSHAEENQGSQATNLLSATQLSGHILDRPAPGQPQTQGKSRPSVTAPLFPVLRNPLRRLCLWSVLEVTGDYVHTYCLRQSQRRWPRGQQHCELQPGEAKSQGDTCW